VCARRASKHSQCGLSMGLCPHCKADMWKDQRTIITPVRLEDGTLRPVLGHETCPTGGKA
jgi:hypothetical protein